MCNVYDLLTYCCGLFNYERTPFGLCVDLYGFERAKETVFATRLLMYSLAANMILRGEY